MKARLNESHYDPLEGDLILPTDRYFEDIMSDPNYESTSQQLGDFFRRQTTPTTEDKTSSPTIETSRKRSRSKSETKKTPPAKKLKMANVEDQHKENESLSSEIAALKQSLNELRKEFKDYKAKTETQKLSSAAAFKQSLGELRKEFNDYKAKTEETLLSHYNCLAAYRHNIVELDAKVSPRYTFVPGD